MRSADTFRPEADRVAGLIREQIIDGIRPPGSRLVEREISEEMGVSRVPVRDALKMLIAEGLAVSRPFAGALVWQATERDIDDLIEVRSGLETLSFSLAARRATISDLAELSADLARERRAAQAGDVIGARHAAADFHATVTRISANQLLSELYRVTDGRMRWLLSQHDDLGAMLTEHESLFQAIADGDEKRAGKTAQRHVKASRKAAVAHLAALVAGSDRRESPEHV
ncbi:hypothetical protein A6A27_24690 [Micromonospora sp. CB01531]|nr:hypothetical protein A6A27_24690 [Micromonospora sp. CB01531]